MTEFAGTLRQRIRIERPVTTRTPTGVQEYGWEPVASCLAAIELEGVGPQSEAQALSAMPKLRVTIRRRQGVGIDQRIRWGARTLMIRQLLDDPRNPDRLTMRCEEARA
jgi:SPP1 family predicted phage head-tail adaptor